MSEETDYSEGTEQSQNADKAFHNRDVLKWMDRLERGKKFVDAANMVINAVEGVLVVEPKRSFISTWMSNVKDKSAPRSVIADVNLLPPTIKKIHRDDNDKSFIRYKEYPFYYVLPISAMFTATPASPECVPDTVGTAEWFNNVVSPMIERDVMSKVEEELDKKFSNLFHFPKGSEDFKEGFINVVFTASLRVTLAASGLPRSSIMPFKDSADYREMLVNEISVAIGRCLPPPEARVD